MLWTARRKNGVTLGHFDPNSWKAPRPGQAHEIAINPRLFETPDELLGTLVHEAAHALLFATAGKRATHVAGCGPDGFYHRTEFRDACSELGLECRFRNRRYGWATTQWPRTGPPAKYDQILAMLRDMPLGTGTIARRRQIGKPLPKAGHIRLTCNCDRAIYLTPRAFGEGPITCGNCGRPFRKPGAKKGD